VHPTFQPPLSLPFPILPICYCPSLLYQPVIVSLCHSLPCPTIPSPYLFAIPLYGITSSCCLPSSYPFPSPIQREVSKSTVSFPVGRQMHFGAFELQNIFHSTDFVWMYCTNIVWPCYGVGAFPLSDRNSVGLGGRFEVISLNTQIKHW